jgi:hypothetical protein
VHAIAIRSKQFSSSIKKPVVFANVTQLARSIRFDLLTWQYLVVELIVIDLGPLRRFVDINVLLSAVAKVGSPLRDPLPFFFFFALMRPSPG